ncbi:MULTISPECIES: FTR1 family protein [unclassified Meiothermus]|uniref:FTR1 family protein n=1 Tax=unclassified Meiothermus TaxID=370471 RepID=UPI000D7CEA9C|nr:MULTISPECIES: FTR1 family protein [unclassified Meiothermus]PZA05739.1 iron permease [Meiothermus sp. Pnk-1]RYM30757.1 iron permease [Meiothermus sp. PNK-Is4]
MVLRDRDGLLRATALALLFFLASAFLLRHLAVSGPLDPEAHTALFSRVLDTAILIFREGLEAVLVLAALAAGLLRRDSPAYRPLLAGAGLAFAASVLSYFLAVRVVGLAESTFSELQVQAATGLLAVGVLLLVMNWFFHRVYWTGWIGLHTRKQGELLRRGAAGGLWLLGFSAVYREGFEVALFLQNIRLRVGEEAVAYGALVGVLLSLAVAALTFIFHRRLPYKRMLVFTGALLGLVLLVMVGEEAQEMQLAHWLPTTLLPLRIPDWMGVWFSLFPTRETLLAQALAAALVLGSYLKGRSKAG